MYVFNLLILKSSSTMGFWLFSLQVALETQQNAHYGSRSGNSAKRFPMGRVLETQQNAFLWVAFWKLSKTLSYGSRSGNSAKRFPMGRVLETQQNAFLWVAF
ncbi:hypothetical protein [Leptospira noguchii]|uniref:Uncharacterized protein n=2 Tax=Leptospira noguchii TaxID=28182 RepID=M6Y8A3_9LEPT|nr:hypothetical protein [Leptospira noguchii]EMO88076.1 hypothetical protein LEP1GSC024_0400 [Leptospira noguchii str. 2001034031]